MPHPITPAPRLSLADGAMIPQLGFGLYKVPAADAARLSRAAIEIGYRHLDTAAFYDNETERRRGRARAAGVPREDLFVASKVWKDDNGYDSTLRAFDASMAAAGPRPARPLPHPLAGAVDRPVRRHVARADPAAR